MYRSASTWQYNVAGHLVEQFRSGRRAGYCAHPETLPPSSADWQVIKAHDAHDVFAGLLVRGEARALYVYRDLRDVAYSLIHKANSTFEAVIASGPLLHQAMASFDFWTRQPHTLVQRYEDLVSNPVAAVHAIAVHLDLSLPPGAAEDLAHEYSLERNRQRAYRVAEHYRSRGMNLFDPVNALCRDEQSQWHWNHIREGRIGSWRSVATPREVAILARRCGRWLIEQGYEPDYAWAVGALEHVLFEEYDRLQADLAGLRHSGAVLAIHLDAACRQAANLGDRLAELERLGPRALRLAYVFHDLAIRHPRLRTLVKRALRTARDLLRGMSHRSGAAGGLDTRTAFD
jgi:hypothetical protein